MGFSTRDRQMYYNRQRKNYNGKQFNIETVLPQQQKISSHPRYGRLSLLSHKCLTSDIIVGLIYSACHMTVIYDGSIYTMLTTYYQTNPHRHEPIITSIYHRLTQTHHYHTHAAAVLIHNVACSINQIIYECSKDIDT